VLFEGFERRTGVRILVVDDDAAVRDSLARTLRFEGYQVDAAQDGRQASTRSAPTNRTPSSST
jgi:DNA-binding response OmpR family regulator